MLPATLLVLTVRIYAPTADFPSTAAAEREAAEILAHAGIAVAWTDCRPVSSRPERCGDPLQHDEIAVRLLNASDSGFANRPLGEALVDRASGSGALATIYINRIDALAAASGTAASIVFGRALAHELGHLLLGSQEHRRRGLMRAAWSPQVIRTALPGEWRFTPDDALRLRRHLAQRSSTSLARLSSN